MSAPDNLKADFVGNPQANLMYLAFSPKVRKRWVGKVGRLLQAVVEAERGKSPRAQADSRSTQFQSTS